MNASTTELLNIKQAAQFLNVSEISLRRWTDSGKLACLRVGGRRERRFEQQDLVDFLEKQSGANPGSREIRAIDEAKTTRILLEGISINYGNHLCSLYETDLGRIKLSVPFLADGLRNGHKCFLLASRRNQRPVVKHLMAAYSDTGAAIESARLVLCEGFPGSVELYDYFEQQFLEATRQGDHYIRVLGDMAWAIDKGISMADLMAFEQKYNHTLARNFSVVSLCQYDARRFAGTDILNALKTHEDTFQYPLSRFIGL